MDKKWSSILEGAAPLVAHRQPVEFGRLSGVERLPDRLKPRISPVQRRQMWLSIAFVGLPNHHMLPCISKAEVKFERA
jgi:hypothetical protein